MGPSIDYFLEGSLLGPPLVPFLPKCFLFAREPYIIVPTLMACEALRADSYSEMAPSPSDATRGLWILVLTSVGNLSKKKLQQKALH